MRGSENRRDAGSGVSVLGFSSCSLHIQAGTSNSSDSLGGLCTSIQKTRRAGRGVGGGEGRQGNGEKLLEHLANGLMVFTLSKRVKGGALSSVPSHLGEQWMPCSSLGDQVTF